jgi:regulatory protein
MAPGDGAGARPEAAESAAGYDAEAAAAMVDALLDGLAADGYLDETRFVESRLHLRARRFGAQRIQQELAQHGLKLDAEQQAALRSTELDRAREVWTKRFGAEPARDAVERARQTRFLLARGFAPEVVHRLLRA